MEKELLSYISKISDNPPLKCNVCNKAHKCIVKQFLNHIQKTGVENFNYTLLDESMANIYDIIKNTYLFYEDKTIDSICGLSKDGHFNFTNLKRASHNN